MSHWETTSSLDADLAPAAIWAGAYLDAAAWPRWNAELKRARLDGPLRLGAEARIVFRSGLRLRFRVVEFEPGRLFTDEARLPGARMGHRHQVEPTPDGGSRLTNTSTSRDRSPASGGGSSGRRRRGRCRLPSTPSSSLHIKKLTSRQSLKALLASAR